MFLWKLLDSQDNVRKPRTQGPNIMGDIPRKGKVKGTINFTDDLIPQTVCYIRGGADSTIVVCVLRWVFGKVTIQLDDICILQHLVQLLGSKMYECHLFAKLVRCPVNADDKVLVSRFKWGAFARPSEQQSKLLIHAWNNEKKFSLRTAVHWEGQSKCGERTNEIDDGGVPRCWAR